MVVFLDLPMHASVVTNIFWLLTWSPWNKCMQKDARIDQG